MATSEDIVLVSGVVSDEDSINRMEHDFLKKEAEFGVNSYTSLLCVGTRKDYNAENDIEASNFFADTPLDVCEELAFPITSID